MRFACQSCGKAYNLPEEKIATKSNVKLKCRVCGSIVEVKKHGQIVAVLLGTSAAGTDSPSVARVSEAPPPFSSGASNPVSAPTAVAPSPVVAPVAAPPPVAVMEPAAPPSRALTPPAPPPLSRPESMIPAQSELGPGPTQEEEEEEEATAPAPPVSSAAAQLPLKESPVAVPSPQVASEPAVVARPLPVSAGEHQVGLPKKLVIQLLLAAFASGFVISRILVGWGY